MKSSKIEWTHSTFNPWWGCEKVSPGCTNCYAEAFAKRVGQKVWGGTSPRRFFGDAHWNEPVKWNREAAKSGQPWRVFCASMADVFEDRRDLDPQRERLWTLIDATPALTWLLLTKRPQNIKRLARSETALNRSNVWLGTTVERPEEAWRIDALQTTPAWIRFLSVEPQVAPFDAIDLYGIEWVIQGGESGGKARPFDLAWARWMRDRCRESDVAYHLKQLGGYAIDSTGRPSPLFDRVALTSAKGGDWSEWPEDLRVREYPTVGVT